MIDQEKTLVPLAASATISIEEENREILIKRIRESEFFTKFKKGLEGLLNKLVEQFEEYEKNTIIKNEIHFGVIYDSFERSFKKYLIKVLLDNIDNKLACDLIYNETYITIPSIVNFNRGGSELIDYGMQLLKLIKEIFFNIESDFGRIRGGVSNNVDNIIRNGYSPKGFSQINEEIILSFLKKGRLRDDEFIDFLGYLGKTLAPIDVEGLKKIIEITQLDGESNVIYTRLIKSLVCTDIEEEEIINHLKLHLGW